MNFKLPSFLFYTAILFVTAFGSVQNAHAGPKDAAYDDRGSFVQDSWGKCVRTKWDGSDDPCNPTPPPPPPVVPKPMVKKPFIGLEQRTIYFDFNSHDLTSEAIYKMNMIAQLINQSMAIRDVRIVGYTDQIGSSAYNQKLSEQRVQAVKEYLDQRTRLDVTAADIRGAGKAPAESECAALKKKKERIRCMHKERRAEIQFTYER